MKNKVLLIGIIGIVIIGISYLFLTSKPMKLKDLEKEVLKIELPEDIEKVAVKSAIGDSGGNGGYTTLRVVLLVKTDKTLSDLKTEFENKNLKFDKHYKTRNYTPIFYITHCESSTFKSARDFSLEFEELTKLNSYTGYYFIEFVE